MGNVKKDLLAEIDRKIARKKEVRAKMLLNNTYECFILDFIKDIEDLNIGSVTGHAWLTMTTFSVEKLERQMQTIDYGCKIDVSWHTSDGKEPLVNGVLIKWSSTYQAKNNVEPELFVDVANLMLSKI